MEKLKSFYGGALLPVYLCVLCSCTTFKFDSDQTTQIPADFVGLAPLSGDPTSELWDQVVDFHATWVRQGFFWGTIEPKKGQFDFSYSDRYLQNAEKRGLKVVVVLDYDVDWIHEPQEPKPAISAAALPYYLEYVRAVVTRYKNRDVIFEIWNEPNLGIFWKGSRDEYCQLAMETAKLIKGIDSNIKVAVGGFFQVPEDFLETLFRNETLSIVDYVSFHPYDLDENGSLNQVFKLKDFLRKRQLKKEIIVSEFGYPTGGSYITGISLRGQSIRLLKFMIGAAINEVRLAIWYTSADYDNAESAESWNSEGFFGLAYPNLQKKPSGHTFALLGKYLNASRFDPTLVQVDSTLRGALQVTSLLQKDGTFVVILWTTGFFDQDVRLKTDGAMITEENIFTEERETFNSDVSFMATKVPKIFHISAATRVSLISNSSDHSPRIPTASSR